MRHALIGSNMAADASSGEQNARSGFCTYAGVVSCVDPVIGALFTRDARNDSSQLWNWDRDTACIRNGRPSSISTLQPGDLVTLFAEVSGERILLTRVEAASAHRLPAKAANSNIVT